MHFAEPCSTCISARRQKSGEEEFVSRQARRNQCCDESTWARNGNNRNVILDCGADESKTGIACKGDPQWELLAVQALVEQWKDAGIRVKINLMPSTQFWEVWTKVPFGFTGWTHRPLGTMVLGLAYRTGVPWNEARYSNKDFDSLLTQAEGTIDVNQRRELMGKLEAILQDDGPIVQPVWRSVFTFMDKRVLGFKIHPTLYMFGHQLAITT